jgi:hypothetical protein
MNCRQFTEFLHEYLLGNLPAEERAELRNTLPSVPGVSLTWTATERPSNWRKWRLRPPRMRRPPTMRPRSWSKLFFVPAAARREFPQHTTHTVLLPFHHTIRTRVATFPKVGASVVTFLPSGHPNL